MPKARPPRHLQRALGIALAGLLLAAAVALWWVGQTRSFLHWALQRAAVASDGGFAHGAVRGTLLGGFQIASLR